MGKPVPQKQRLEELLALARTYRNWSGREMAAELGRDPHNLVPNNGIPRLDLVLRLAEALEWTPQDVIDELCREGDGSTEAGRPSEGDRFDEHDRRAFEAHQSAQYSRMLHESSAMLQCASTAEQRALARLRECSAWEGLGRYSLALQAVQNGLREQHDRAGVRFALRRNLAYCHYALGNLEEASAMATCLIAELHEAGPGPDIYFEGSLGFVHYVRGSCGRVVVGAGGSRRGATLRAAVADLTTAQSLLLRAWEIHSVPIYRGIAKVCEGAILELEVLDGRLAPDAALQTMLAELDAVIDPGRGGEPAMLEALGWWCIFGCNIALRAPGDPAEVERVMAIMTNKADEIAGHLGNWLLRERVWSLELQRREVVATRLGSIATPTMDLEDTRAIVGTMARFPAFRATGWSILHSSEIVEKE